MNFTVFLLKLCPRKNCKSACDCEGSASKIGKNDEQRQSSNWGSITRWVTFESLRSRVKLNLGKRFTQLQCKRYDIDTAKKELNEDVCVEHKRLNHFIHQKESRVRRLSDLCLKVSLIVYFLLLYVCNGVTRPCLKTVPVCPCVVKLLLYGQLLITYMCVRRA